MCKLPDSTSLANRMAQSMFCVKIPADKPNRLSLAILIASSMSLKALTATAGPNSFSREIRDPLRLQRLHPALREVQTVEISSHKNAASSSSIMRPSVLVLFWSCLHYTQRYSFVLSGTILRLDNTHKHA